MIVHVLHMHSRAIVACRFIPGHPLKAGYELVWPGGAGSYEFDALTGIGKGGASLWRIALDDHRAIRRDPAFEQHHPKPKKPRVPRKARMPKPKSPAVYMKKQTVLA